MYLTAADEKRAKVPANPGADWVNKNTSFVYIAGKEDLATNTGGDVVVAYEKKAKDQGGKVTLQQAKQLVEESKKKLASLRKAAEGQ